MNTGLYYKRIVFSCVSTWVLFILTGTFCWAAPASPSLSVATDRFVVTLEWTSVHNADGYTLSYAPFPYADYIGQVEVGNITGASFRLWSGAAFYVAVQAYDETGNSDFSNIENFTIQARSYPIVDTGQTAFYDNETEITEPAQGEAFYGQDAQYTGNQPSYTLSADGLTVHDNVTDLTWTRSPDLDGNGVIDVNDKLTFDEALIYPDTLNARKYGGYSDWGLPTMKELYSLMNFRGTDPDPRSSGGMGETPFIDTDYFDFAYGDMSAGERIIDSQFWSASAYLGKVFVNQPAAFGLNLADGRIKGYPTGDPVGKLNFVYFVRGNSDYGVNDFIDNGDGTVTDNATGLMWSKADSGAGMNWEEALAWVQQRNAENYLGYSDWRLPDAKEMQSIVDYSRAPDATGSAAIDPVFSITEITNEGGRLDYPWFWTGTTHVRSSGNSAAGVYICFGRAMGYMFGSWTDVHGAGAQRSGRKGGDFSGLTYEPDGYYLVGSSQGDAIRIYNFVRPVRDTDTVTVSDPQEGAAFEGYNVFSSLNSKTVYLMDNYGNFVHSWDTDFTPGNSVYLLENGELLHTGNVHNSTFGEGGAGGIVQTIDWYGNAIWEYEYSGSSHLQHHDVEMLPNGNVLMIAWQHKTEPEAIAAGRDPSMLDDGELWPDSVIEVQPSGSNTGRIVWEWHVWDHLVQDYDSSKSNYGVVADHPELVDINFVTLGGADWTHINSIDYNSELDQILLSVHNFSEIWVIDHSITTAEAAAHSGGFSGKGGDLLYRWGNPQTYHAGSAADQQLFVQHDAEWIDAGNPGEGNILIFNNGQGRPDGNYSSVDEIITPVNADGSYAFVLGSAYGPDGPVWSYTADNPTDFFAMNISGQQRLPNGNTLICNGPNSHFFEVTSSGETVWEYDFTGPVFRVERYAPEYSGFNGTPLDDEASNSVALFSSSIDMLVNE